MIVDKKTNLARGFADVNTPPEHSQHLLFSLQEKRAQIRVLRAKLEAQIAAGKPKDWTEGQWRDLKTRHHQAVRAQIEFGQKANKKVNYHILLVDRLKQVVPDDLFSQCCVLAKQDKERLLDQIAAFEDEDTA